MERPDRAADSPNETPASTALARGFWSSVAAIVGVFAVAVGGILTLGVQELRGFSVSVLIMGVCLLMLAVVISPGAALGFLRRRPVRHGANAVVMSIALLGIAVSANLLLDRHASRFDVTATRIFTLAPQTAQMLDGLEGSVRANAFFVPSDPGSALAKQRAEDLFSEFAAFTGKFTYRFIDPEVNRGLAVQYGVPRYPTVVFEDLESGTQQAVSAVTEQDFVTGIVIVAAVRQKRVYLLTGHNESSVTRDAGTGEVNWQGFDYALQAMQRDNYVVESLDLSHIERVPAEAAVLVIAGPQQELDPAHTKALTDYIRAGGRILALLDPKSPDSFVDLFSQWGVAVGRQSLADSLSNVAGDSLTPLVQRSNGQYVSSETIDVPIADRIDVTFFPDVTSVNTVLPREDMPDHITFSPLAVTTPASWLESDPEAVDYDPASDDRGPFTIAAAIETTGTVDGVEPHSLAKFVVFGDSDFARNKFLHSSDNAVFLLNAVNWLAEDYDLIDIGPKIPTYRELVVNGRQRGFIKWSGWLLPPSVMLMLGAVVWWRRR